MHKRAIRFRAIAIALVAITIAGSCASSTELSQLPAPLPAATAVATDVPAPAPPSATPTAEPAPAPTTPPAPAAATSFKSGAQVMLQKPERLAGLRVGLIANQASQVNGESLIDLLHTHPDINLVALFAPEHGVRGDLEAGEQVPGGIDPTTGVIVHSLYGDTREPTAEMLADIDLLIYDLQGVGARYYTFISTMGLAMQAAAANDVAFVVLDRPLPSQAISSSGFVRDADQESFVSAYEIPTFYALTPAELALAIKHDVAAEGLDELRLSVFPVAGWNPGSPWPADQAWIPPSPGLPTLAAARSYPATVWFEATSVSFGKGTDQPFGQIGAPWIDGERLATELNDLALPGVQFEATTFTPQPNATTANPRFAGELLAGVRLVVDAPEEFTATTVGVYLLEAVKRQADEQGLTLIDRPDFFDLLAGTTRLRQGLTDGAPAERIVSAWGPEAANFDLAIAPWMLYPRPL